MPLVSLAIVGKDNEPLYMRDFTVGKSSSDRPESPNEIVEKPDPFGFFTMSNNPHESSSMRHQFIVHAALDRFEEITGPNSGNRWRTPGSTGSDAMWVGLLCPMEELRVYGYLTNTNIKFMAVLEDEDARKQSGVSESGLKSLFASLHDLYVEYTLNPFSKIKSKIISLRFDDGVLKHVNIFNGGEKSKVTWI